MQDKTPMEKESGPPGDSQFRSNIPAYTAPDRAAWAAEHFAPYELKGVPPKFLSRAAAAVTRDASTLGFDKAVNAHTAIDEVNEAVHEHYSCSEEGNYLFAHVFYDPNTQSFWAYPFGP